jgi:hypothetical protein
LSSRSSSWSWSPVSRGSVFAASGDSVGKDCCGARCPVECFSAGRAAPAGEPGRSSVLSMVPGAVESACLGDAGSVSGPGQSSLMPMVSVVVGSIGVAVPISRNRRWRLVSGSSVPRQQDRAGGSSRGEANKESTYIIGMIHLDRALEGPRRGHKLSKETMHTAQRGGGFLGPAGRRSRGAQVFYLRQQRARI